MKAGECESLGTRLLEQVASQPKYVIMYPSVCLFSLMVFIEVSFVVCWFYPPEMNVEHSADLSLATGELNVAYTHASELKIDNTLKTVMTIGVIDFAFTKDI